MSTAGGWGAAENRCRGLPIRHGQDLIVNSSLLSSLVDIFLRCSQSAIQYVIVNCVVEQWQILQPVADAVSTAAARLPPSRLDHTHRDMQLESACELECCKKLAQQLTGTA